MAGINDYNNCCLDNITRSYCPECGNPLKERRNLVSKEQDIRDLSELLNICSENITVVGLSKDPSCIYGIGSIKHDITTHLREIDIKPDMCSDLKMEYCDKVQNIKLPEKSNKFYEIVQQIEKIMTKNNWCFYFIYKQDPKIHGVSIYLRHEMESQIPFEAKMTNIDRLFDNEITWRGLKFKYMSLDTYETLNYFADIRKKANKIHALIGNGSSTDILSILLGLK